MFETPKINVTKKKKRNNNTKILIKHKKSTTKLKYSSTRNSKKNFNTLSELFELLKFFKKNQMFGKK
jgi:hypothetical protein